MNKTIPRACVALAAQLLLSSCAPYVFPAETESPLLELIIPDGYRKIAPAALDTSAQILGQTVTVFRGVPKEVQFTYDRCTGPRTGASAGEPIFCVRPCNEPFTLMLESSDRAQRHPRS